MSNETQITQSIPQWQKDLIDARLAEYNKNPADTLDWDEVLKKFDKEDEYPPSLLFSS